MKVYLTPPQPSRGLERIATALRRYAPAGVEVLSFPRNADLTVIYAIGRRDAVQRQVADILSRNKKYAVIQVCLKSTMTPDPWDWVSIWRDAEVVWSYYDLERALSNPPIGDLVRFAVWSLRNFYHAPPGVDASVFYPREIPKQYVIGTCGLSRLSESVRECILATAEFGQRMFHLGMDMTFYNEHVSWAKDLDDLQVATRWSMCEFVSGLRRKEGFELPAAEGLLCGARPIVFDTPDYRWNYRNWAEYIEETDRQGVVDQLVQLFRQGARPVTEHEREEAAHWFNWERIVGEFWQRCL